MQQSEKNAPPVVIAEDNFLTSHLLVAALEKAGYLPSAGRDGDQVSRLLDKSGAKLLVLNLNLLRPSGMEYLRVLRPRERGIRVIGFLSPGQADMKPLASSLGVDHFFENPFDPEELIRKVDELAGSTS
jgi:chemosensory pili system protein ChpA (sensor histidine kinase/response regulator)